MAASRALKAASHSNWSSLYRCSPLTLPRVSRARSRSLEISFSRARASDSLAKAAALSGVGTQGRLNCLWPARQQILNWGETGSLPCSERAKLVLNYSDSTKRYSDAVTELKPSTSAYTELPRRLASRANTHGSQWRCMSASMAAETSHSSRSFRLR